MDCNAESRDAGSRRAEGNYGGGLLNTVTRVLQFQRLRCARVVDGNLLVCRPARFPLHRDHGNAVAPGTLRRLIDLYRRGTAISGPLTFMIIPEFAE